MAAVTFRELKKKSVILFENEPYEIVDRYFRAKQQREAITTVIMKNLFTGKVLEKNFQSSESVKEVELEESNVQFLYKEADKFYFMNQKTYEQLSLNKSQLGNSAKYLKEEITLKIKMFNDTPVDIILPSEVSLKVVESPPGVKGDTAQGGSKIVILETGMKLSVPLYIKKGENVIVKTKTGNFDRRE